MTSKEALEYVKMCCSDGLQLPLDSFISFYIYKNDNDFNKIKEW